MLPVAHVALRTGSSMPVPGHLHQFKDGVCFLHATNVQPTLEDVYGIKMRRFKRMVLHLAAKFGVCMHDNRQV
jgi:hypothetical protein